LIIDRRQKIPGGAIGVDTTLVVARDTDFDIFVIATLTAEPGIDCPATAKPPRAGEAAQKAAHGKQFIARARGEDHWRLFLHSQTGQALASTPGRSRSERSFCLPLSLSQLSVP
jgi:hypothetical protein